MPSTMNGYPLQSNGTYRSGPPAAQGFQAPAGPERTWLRSQPFDRDRWLREILSRAARKTIGHGIPSVGPKGIPQIARRFLPGPWQFGAFGLDFWGQVAPWFYMPPAPGMGEEPGALPSPWALEWSRPFNCPFDPPVGVNRTWLNHFTAECQSVVQDDEPQQGTVIAPIFQLHRWNWDETDRRVRSVEVWGRPLEPGEDPAPPYDAAVLDEEADAPDTGPDDRRKRREQPDRQGGEYKWIDPHAVRPGVPWPEPRALPRALINLRPENAEWRVERTERGPKATVEPVPRRKVAVWSLETQTMSQRWFREPDKPTRPGDQVHERKFVANLSSRSRLGLLVSGVGEMKDFLECMWKSLPVRNKAKGQRGRSSVRPPAPGYRPKLPTPQQMVRELWDNRDLLGVEWFKKVSRCQMEELLSDAVHGTAGRMGALASPIVTPGRPVGIGTGPAT